MPEILSDRAKLSVKIYRNLFDNLVRYGECRHYVDSRVARVPDVEIYLSDIMPLLRTFLKHNILTINVIEQTLVQYTVTYNSEIFGMYGGKVAKSTFSIIGIKDVIEPLREYLRIWNNFLPINGYPKGGA